MQPRDVHSGAGPDHGRSDSRPMRDGQCDSRDLPLLFLVVAMQLFFSTAGISSPWFVLRERAKSTPKLKTSSDTTTMTNRY